MNTKCGSDGFSSFDISRMDTNKQTPRQTSKAYILMLDIDIDTWLSIIALMKYL